jgi:hypothetical protein
MGAFAAWRSASSRAEPGCCALLVAIRGYARTVHTVVAVPFTQAASLERFDVGDEVEIHERADRDVSVHEQPAAWIVRLGLAELSREREAARVALAVLIARGPQKVRALVRTRVKSKRQPAPFDELKQTPRLEALATLLASMRQRRRVSSLLLLSTSSSAVSLGACRNPIARNEVARGSPLSANVLRRRRAGDLALSSIDVELAVTSSG